jgi:hypothetical protein
MRVTGNVPVHVMKAYRATIGMAPLILKLDTKMMSNSFQCPGCLIPMEGTPVPIEQQVRAVPEPVLMSWRMKNLFPVVNKKTIAYGW